MSNDVKFLKHPVFLDLTAHFTQLNVFADVYDVAVVNTNAFYVTNQMFMHVYVAYAVK